MTPRFLSRAEAEVYAGWLGISLASCHSAPQRAERLPAWLTHAFVATEAARGKLQAWAAARGTLAAPVLSPAEVLVAQQHVGDALLAHLVAHVLAALPPPMRDYLLRQAVYVSIGTSIRGFCSPALGSDAQCWRLVCASHGDDAELFEAIVAHESAHAWLLDEPVPGDRAPLSFVSDTIASTHLADVAEAARPAVEVARGHRARHERQCIALVRALGWRDPSDFFAAAHDVAGPG
jgi:hypothetical protein